MTGSPSRTAVAALYAPKHLKKKVFKDGTLMIDPAKNRISLVDAAGAVIETALLKSLAVYIESGDEFELGKFAVQPDIDAPDTRVDLDSNKPPSSPLPAGATTASTASTATNNNDNDSAFVERYKASVLKRQQESLLKLSRPFIKHPYAVRPAAAAPTPQPLRHSQSTLPQKRQHQRPMNLKPCSNFDFLFPSPFDARSGRPGPSSSPAKRIAVLANTYPHLEAYQQSLTIAMVELLNTNFAKTGIAFQRLLSLYDLSYFGEPSPPLKRQPVSSISYFEQIFETKDIHFYVQAALMRKKTNASSLYGRNCSSSSSGNGSGSGNGIYLLELASKKSSSSYATNDIWVISRAIDFSIDYFFAYSTFYGPNTESQVELALLSANIPWDQSTSKHQVYAIRLGNYSNELEMLHVIQQLSEVRADITIPVMRSLLRPQDPFIENPCDPKLNLSRHQIQASLESICAEYTLNEQQKAALQSVADSIPVLDDSSKHNSHNKAPITLVHGVFGSGKSYLLAVVAVFLSRVFQQQSAITPKIFVSSLTNVAVDRILSLLLKLGFVDFVRIGNLKKIDKQILPHSMHSESNDTSEIKEMLAEYTAARDSQDAGYLHLKKALEICKVGDYEKRIRNTGVVGLTASATSFHEFKQLFDDHGNPTHFHVLILDECSQMIEPLSLLPILKFKPCLLVMNGDPLQLPPTIVGPSSAHNEGLEKTCFERLALGGLAPTLLNTQYRCHPAIADLASRLFYQNRLINGIHESDRTPVFQDLPALCFVDIPCSSNAGTGAGLSSGPNAASQGSKHENPAEVRAIRAILELVLSGDGFEPSGMQSLSKDSIGIITLFRAQARLLTGMLSNACLISSSSLMAGDARGSPKTKISPKTSAKLIQAATVDSFQGAEKDIIFLSTVGKGLAGPSGLTSDGFIDNPKRLNVAITRAKSHLVILGCGRTLMKSPLWKAIIDACKEASSPDVCYFASLASLIETLNGKKTRSTTTMPPAVVLNQPLDDLDYTHKKAKISDMAVAGPSNPIQHINNDHKDDDDDDEKFLRDLLGC